jgi:hypothetical protein
MDSPGVLIPQPPLGAMKENDMTNKSCDYCDNVRRIYTLSIKDESWSKDVIEACGECMIEMMKFGHMDDELGSELEAKLMAGQQLFR